MSNDEHSSRWSNVTMDDTQATLQAYTTGSMGAYTANTCASDSTTPCAPTSTADSTVGAGMNMQSACDALAKFTSEPAIGTDAANACRSATTDGCIYDATAHRVICPTTAAVPRPN